MPITEDKVLFYRHSFDPSNVISHERYQTTVNIDIDAYDVIKVRHKNVIANVDVDRLFCWLAREFSSDVDIDSEWEVPRICR